MKVMVDPKRLYSFDLLRLFAVLLALTSHFLLSQGGDWRANDLFINLKAITRSAMPCLLIIFGFMIEYVYARRWTLKGPKVVLERMLIRSILCYLAFISLSFISFSADHTSISQFLGSFVFMGKAEHAQLFAYYTLLIPIAFLFIWVRFTYGWKAKLLLITFLLILVECFNFMVGGSQVPLISVLRVFLGTGDTYGPSIVHSLVLITLGELVAGFALGARSPLQKCIVIGLPLFSLMLVLFEINSIGWDNFVKGITVFNNYRAHNSPEYFAYGILAFSLLWGFSWLIVQKLKFQVKEKISFYGGNTFSIFYFGNALILLTPRYSTDITICLFLLVVTLLLSVCSVNALEWASKNWRVIQSVNLAIESLANTVLMILRFVLMLRPKKGMISDSYAQKEEVLDLLPEKQLITNLNNNARAGTLK